MTSDDIRTQALAIASRCGEWGWDSCGAAPVRPIAIGDGLTLALRVVEWGDEVVEFSPLNSGGVRVVWTRDRVMVSADVEGT